MPGTRWGMVESYHNQGTATDNTRSVAAALLAEFDHAANGGVGVVERVACNYGRLDAGSGASGFGAIGSGSPIGHDGFALYRMKPAGSRVYSIYFLIQWGTSTYTLGTRTTTIGSIPRVDPAKWLNASNSAGVIGISVAAALTSGGADASPWLGTTANNGQDTKGTVLGTGPVWGAPVGGSLFTWPRSNHTGGTHNTNKENLGALVDVNNNAGVNPLRVHVAGDDQNLVIAIDAQADSTYNIFRIVEMTLATGNAHPFHHVVSQDFAAYPIGTNTGYGTTAGSATTEGSIPAWNGTAYDSRIVYQSFEVNILQSATFQPSSQRQSAGVTTLSYDALNTIYYAANEATMYGLVGVDAGFMPLVYGMAIHDRNSDLSYAAIGPVNSTGSAKWMFQWDLLTTPGSGATVAGSKYRR